MNGVYVIHPPDGCEPVLVFSDRCDAHDYAGARWGTFGDWFVEEALIIGDVEARRMIEDRLAEEEES